MTKREQEAAKVDVVSRESNLQTSCPGGLIWQMQKLWRSKDTASGQRNSPWKQDKSSQTITI